MYVQLLFLSLISDLHIFSRVTYIWNILCPSKAWVTRGSKVSWNKHSILCVLIIHILWFHSHWVASWITKLYAHKHVQNTIFKIMRCHMNHDYIIHYGQFPQSIHMADSNALQPITENLSVTDISVPIVVEVSSRFLVMMGLCLLSGRLMKILTWMNSKISGDFLFLSNNEGKNEFKEAMQISYDKDITNLVPHALGNILNKYFKILLKRGCFMH